MNGKMFLTLCCFFLLTTLSAQQFGAFPPSTRWQQIHTDTARVIFDNKIYPDAQRIAAIVHRMMRDDSTSLGAQLRKINILLHPNTTIANGYVALAPFRSEFYMIPSSNIFRTGATPWNEDLAVHEFRHVQQYSNFNKGLSRVAGFFFGQNGQALMNALAVPDWFFEGDAVHAETVYTPQGRGRSPYFFNGFKALWHDRRDYSWMKLRNGSLRDWVPSHYPLGYLLTNYGYQQYGPQFWGKVTDDASRFRSLFYPFQNAVKRASGKSFEQFRKDAFASYRREVPAQPAAVRRETPSDFLFPVKIGNDSLLYIRTAFDRIPAFYIRDKRGERRIKQRNITTEDWLSYRNGLVAYTGYTVHPRWSLTDYSNIYLLDVKTRLETQLTFKQRYFTPDISPDGQRVAALYFSDSVQAELHLLDLSGSVVQKVLPQAYNDLFVHPRFINDSSLVVGVRHADASMSLQRVHLPQTAGDAPRFDILLPRSSAIVGYPAVAGSKVYFVSSVTGNDEIFSLDLDDPLPAASPTQLTAGVTGSYYPSVYGDSLFVSTFTSNGFRIGRSSLSNPPTAKTIRANDQRRMPFAIALDTVTRNLLAASGTGNYPVGNYPKTTGLFNFHSRQVTYTDPEITASIFSDNILNTFSNELFYRYNQNESSHAFGLNTFYGGFFPVLTAGATYTANRTLRTTVRTETLNQKEARFGYYIPLNYTGGKTVKSLVLGNNYVYTETTPTGGSRDRINGSSANYLHHFVNWSQQLPRAPQQIFTRFGYTVNLAHRHLLGDNGFQFLGGAALFLPSIRNHSLVVAANWQETDTSNVVFSNRFANSRGYNDFFFSRMWRITGNYHMPLFYPDWGFGNIVYFLRVRSNFFYDYTMVFSRDKRASREQRSVGAEIYFDTRWWNALPVNFGVRVSHLLDSDFSGQRPAGTNRFEIILPVDLIPR